jgi:hypothetical protein
MHVGMTCLHCATEPGPPALGLASFALILPSLPLRIAAQVGLVVRMKAIDRYSLAPPGTKARRAMLERRGGTRAVEVDGTVLEAQFELDDGSTLVWLTDDSPYDEGLHVYLLDPEDALQDAVEAGADFAAGILKLLETGTSWVEFQFFLNAATYRLDVFAKARLRFRLPAGWKYKALLKAHRLAISTETGGRDGG